MKPNRDTEKLLDKMSDKTKNILLRGNIDDWVLEFYMSKNALKQVKGIGKKAFNEIISVLGSEGVNLPDDNGFNYKNFFQKRELQKEYDEIEQNIKDYKWELKKLMMKKNEHREAKRKRDELQNKIDNIKMWDS
jgi:hypothetical protein